MGGVSISQEEMGVSEDVLGMVLYRVLMLHQYNTATAAGNKRRWSGAICWRFGTAPEREETEMVCVCISIQACKIMICCPCTI